MKTRRFMEPDVWKYFTEGVQSERDEEIVFLHLFCLYFGCTSVAVIRRQR